MTPPPEKGTYYAHPLPPPIVGLLKVEAIHEIIHEHGAYPDLPTARTPDLPTPANVMEAETSPHANIWRHTMNREFQGLLQFGIFAPI